MITHRFRRVVQDFRKRRARASFVADMLSDAADIIDDLRAVHAASLRRVRWILVGNFSVAHVGRKVAVIKWRGPRGDLYLVETRDDIAEQYVNGGYLGTVTSVEAATRLLRKAR